MRHINCSWHQLTYASYGWHVLLVEIFEILKFSAVLVYFTQETPVVITVM